MIKNAAGQTIDLLVIDTNTNLPKTGDALNLTGYLRKDDGAVVALVDTTATEIDATTAKGLYSFAVSQEESNADKILFSGVSITSGVIVIPREVLPEVAEATLANQELILDQLQASLTASSAVAANAGTITGFPEALTIGDSYTTALTNFIKVYVRDSLAVPVTGIGTKNFIGADFAPELTVSQGSKNTLVTATCTWVPAAGPVEGYLKVEFPSDQTRRATEGSATMQLVFKWDGGLESTIATQDVVWEPRVTRTLK